MPIKSLICVLIAIYMRIAQSLFFWIWHLFTYCNIFWSEIYTVIYRKFEMFIIPLKLSELAIMKRIHHGFYWENILILPFFAKELQFDSECELFLRRWIQDQKKVLNSEGLFPWNCMTWTGVVFLSVSHKSLVCFSWSLEKI